MSRGVFHGFVVISTTGATVSSATVTVKVSSSGLNATIYNQLTGGSEINNPINLAQIDEGEILFYADAGIRYDIKAISGSFEKELKDIVLTPQGNLENPMTNIGDMIFLDDGGTPARIPFGSSGQILTPDSNNKPGWVDINPLKEFSFSVGLPSASTFENAMIIITDEIGGPALCVSDGTNWKVLATLSSLTNASN